jgi:hypothetical protein
MIYILYIHDKPVIWSSRIEVIDANIAALGSLAQMVPGRIQRGLIT